MEKKPDFQSERGAVEARGEMATAPEGIRRLPAWGHTVFVRSLAMMNDPKVRPLDAEQAAAVARFVAKYVIFDERLVTDVVNVLPVQLSAPDVVNNLIYAVRRSPEAVRVASALQRLASRARQEGHWPSFVVIVSAMQATAAWRGSVADDVFVEAVDRAVHQERWWLAATLVHHRLHDSDGVPLRLCDLVEAHPRLLRERPVTASQAWRLHQARPTVGGWILLATAPTTGCFVPESSAFGSELDTAIETLEAAVGSEPEGVRHVTLARWLAELRGTP